MIRGDLLICVGCTDPLSILSPMGTHERGSLGSQARCYLSHGELGPIMQFLQLLELPLTLLPASLLIPCLDLIIHYVRVVICPFRRHCVGSRWTAIGRISRESLLLLVIFFTIIAVLGLSTAVDLL